jgi:CRP-like cAMP-binding protein
MGEAQTDLHSELWRYCARVSKPKSSVLFRRGEEAFGLFVVFSGRVILDFGVDGPAALTITCSRGSLVGLPACLVRGRYQMTATVTNDAVLGFLTTGEFLSLLRTHPELYPQLLGILSDRLEQADRVQKNLMLPRATIRSSMQMPAY